jgi:hypothetical protein
MLDSMAGGGAIPLEGLRYGLKVYANELNPVAALVLKATLEYPAHFGRGLLGKLRIYVSQTLKNRIGVFEEVVGPLQPILAEMPRIFRRVARGELELAEARQLLDEIAQENPRVAIASLEAYVGEDSAENTQEISHSSPVTQQQLAAWCLVHPASGMRITVVPELGITTGSQDGTRGCLTITWAYVPDHLGIDSTEEIQATFNGELADRHPPTGPASGDGSGEPEGREGVRLLTWGDPYLTAWLEALRGEPLSDDDYRTAGLQRDTNPFESA